MSLGFIEILAIAAIALVVIGPEKFPDFAKIVIRTVRDVRGYWDEAKTELSKELRPVEKEMKELSRYKPEDYIDSLSSSPDNDPDKAVKDAGTDGFQDSQEESQDSEYHDEFDTQASPEPEASEAEASQPEASDQPDTYPYEPPTAEDSMMAEEGEDSETLAGENADQEVADHLGDTGAVPDSFEGDDRLEPPERIDA